MTTTTIKTTNQRDRLVRELQDLLAGFLGDRTRLSDEHERMMMTTTNTRGIAHMQRLAQLAVSLDQVESRIARCRRLLEQLTPDGISPAPADQGRAGCAAQRSPQSAPSHAAGT